MACGPSSRARLRWPVVGAYDSGTGQSRAGLGAWPVAFDVDHLKRFRAPKSSLVLRLPGRPLAG